MHSCSALICALDVLTKIILSDAVHGLKLDNAVSHLSMDKLIQILGHNFVCECTVLFSKSDAKGHALSVYHGLPKTHGVSETGHVVSYCESVSQ